MPDWPLQSAGQLQAVSEGFAVANEGGVQIATPAAANTKGTWTQISASAPFDADGIFITLTKKSAAAMMLLDIGVGATGVEQVIVPNLFVGTASNSSYPKNVFIPIQIKAGEKISARLQSTSATATNIRVAVHFVQASWLGLAAFQKVIDMGTSTAASSGTSLTLPAAINAWSAWTQIVASTSDPIKYLIPFYSEPGAAASATAGISFCIQVGRGASGSEIAIGPEFVFNNSSTACSISGFHGFPCEIPAGQRLALRYAATTVPTTSLHGALYGVVG